jgi:hypothetical protein
MGLRPGYLDRPHPLRLDPGSARYAEVLAAHAAAVARGDDQYRDPLSGWMVMTAATLADQGECCERGCRHCPYLGA